MENDEDFKTITPEIRKKLIKRGQIGRRPSLRWTCVVDVGTYDHGDSKEVNTSTREVKIGDGTNAYERLLERCLETMHLYEESAFRFCIPPKNVEQTIVINLKLFKEEKPYLFMWTDEEKLEESNHFKNIGTELFQKNQTEEAFHKFSSALKLLLTLDSVLEADSPGPEVDNLRVVLYNNLAMCHLQAQNFSSVIELCTKSININSSTKALYRRAVAYIEHKEYEKAENDLVELLKLEPKNKAAMEKYKLVRELDRTNRENYHSVLKKMFN